MKKLIFVFSMIFIVNILLSAELTKIYHGDFGEIDRTVLVFSNRVNYQISQKSSSKRIIINVNNCTKSPNVDPVQVIPSNVLEKLLITENNNKISIIIFTDKKYTLKYFAIKSKPFKLVLDVYNTKIPRTIVEHLSFAKFYYKVGYYSKAIREFKIIEKIAPQNTSIYYYWAKISLNKKRKNTAIRYLKKVLSSAPEYNDAQNLLAKLQPQKSSSKKKTPKQSAVKNNSQPKNVPNYPINVNLSDLQKKYDDYFTSTNNQDLKIFLTASSAKCSGDFQYAILMFKKISTDSPLIKDAYKNLYEIYSGLNDDVNAKLFKSLLNPEATETDSENKSFMKREIPLWIGLLSFLILFIIFLIIIMIYRKKLISDSEPDFSALDVEYHEEKIKEAYNPEKEEPAVEEKTEETGNFNFENPPIIEDELTQEEEEELKKAEDEILFEEEEPIEKNAGFGDEEYKKKMILKLANDGWENASIAKELHISVREVEFVLKMSN